MHFVIYTGHLVLLGDQYVGGYNVVGCSGRDKECMLHFSGENSLKMCTRKTEKEITLKWIFGR
jgi:hypothetical protein